MNLESLSHRSAWCIHQGPLRENLMARYYRSLHDVQKLKAIKTKKAIFH